MQVNDDALALTRHALAASEDRYRRLAEAMPQLVWTLDRDGTLDFVNERWIAYTGLTLAQTAGNERRRVLHPADRPLMARSWRDGAAAREPFELYGRIRRAEDGAFRWFHIRAAPAFEADTGELAGWVATAYDSLAKGGKKAPLDAAEETAGDIPEEDEATAGDLFMAHNAFTQP